MRYVWGITRSWTATIPSFVPENQTPADVPSLSSSQPEIGTRMTRVRTEAGSDPRGHLGVTWGVYLCAGKPPLADIILSHPPDLT